MHGLAVATATEEKLKVGLSFDLGARLRQLSPVSCEGRFLFYRADPPPGEGNSTGARSVEESSSALHFGQAGAIL